MIGFKYLNPSDLFKKTEEIIEELFRLQNHIDISKQNVMPIINPFYKKLLVFMNSLITSS